MGATFSHASSEMVSWSLVCSGTAAVQSRRAVVPPLWTAGNPPPAVLECMGTAGSPASPYGRYHSLSEPARTRNAASQCRSPSICPVFISRETRTTRRISPLRRTGIYGAVWSPVLVAGEIVDTVGESKPSRPHLQPGEGVAHIQQSLTQIHSKPSHGKMLRPCSYQRTIQSSYRHRMNHPYWNSTTTLRDDNTAGPPSQAGNPTNRAAKSAASDDSWMPIPVENRTSLKECRVQSTPPRSHCKHPTPSSSIDRAASSVDKSAAQDQSLAGGNSLPAAAKMTSEGRCVDAEVSGTSRVGQENESPVRGLASSIKQIADKTPTHRKGWERRNNKPFMQFAKRGSRNSRNVGGTSFPADDQEPEGNKAEKPWLASVFNASLKNKGSERASHAMEGSTNVTADGAMLSRQRQMLAQQDADQAARIKVISYTM